MTTSRRRSRAAGHRVLVPYLRGYGRTHFRDPKTPRMAEQAAIGQDLIDFADALKLPRFAVAGYDWGGRAAQVAAALHPDRVRAAVFVGGYSIQDVFAAPRPAAPQVEAAFWYQWYFNTERGRAGLAQNRRALCKLLWQQWSPTWKFSDATYEQTAPSFDNPDFVDCVIHSYRHRNLNAPRRPALRRRRASARRPPQNRRPRHPYIWGGRRAGEAFTGRHSRPDAVPEAGGPADRPRRGPFPAAREARGDVVGPDTSFCRPEMATTRLSIQVPRESASRTTNG